MCHIARRGGMLLFLACCCAPVAWADDADDLRTKAEGLKEQARDLAEKGFTDQAEQLSRKAFKLLEAATADRDLKEVVSKKTAIATDLDAEIAAQQAQRVELAAKLEKLAASEASDEVLREMKQRLAANEKLLHVLQLKRKQQLAATHEKVDKLTADKKATGKLNDLARRIKHLHVAADNLRAAGVDDLADQLLEKATAMEKQAHDLKAQVAEAAAKKDGPVKLKAGNVEQQLDQLRGEIKQLRAEVTELREQLKR